MSPKDIGSLTAQQLMCARTTADMHTHSTCCAHVTQLMGDDFHKDSYPKDKEYGFILKMQRKKRGNFWGYQK